MEVQKRYAHGFIIMQWHTNDMPQLAYLSIYIPGSGSSDASLADQIECYSFFEDRPFGLSLDTICWRDPAVYSVAIYTNWPYPQNSHVGRPSRLALVSSNHQVTNVTRRPLQTERVVCVLYEKCISGGYDEHHLWERHIRILVKPKIFFKYIRYFIH